MSLQIQNETNDFVRVVAWLFAGVLLLGGAAWLVYSEVSQKGGITLSPPYSYTISQSIRNSVDYVDNDHFPNGPEPDNTAYVTDLTEAFTTDFHYSYEASDDMDLTYTYGAVAAVRGTYGIAGSKEDVSSVWSRQFTLVQPVTKPASGKGFVISESIEVPFKDYKEVMDGFRLGLALPINSSMELKVTVRVQGTVLGEEFVDIRTSTVTVPLNVQIYQLASKYDAQDTKQVPELPSTEADRWLPQWRYVVAVIIGSFGLMCFFVALRRGNDKTAYQRELEKIYRYHDGIIIRTSRPAALSADKSVIPVSSFADLLNLEEEIKAPIIATPAGDSATRFMVIDDDIVYMYVLGRERLADIDKAADSSLKRRTKK